MKYFRSFRFDERTGSLSRTGEALPLTRKAADLLACLLERPGMLVTHAQIMQSLWPETHVQPDNVKTLIHELRTVLGDRAQPPLFIRSEPGRGYAFMADVTSAMVPFVSEADAADIPGMIGREAEMAIVDRHLDAAVERCEPQLVIIEGERGFGKTKLCETLAHRAHQHTAARISYGQGLDVLGPVDDYAVLLDALDLLMRQYPVAGSAALARRAPSWLSRLPHWAGRETSVDAGVVPIGSPGGDRLLRELVSVFDELAADVPLLLILEDLQWADAATIECLRVIGRRHVRSRLCVVATYCGSADLPMVHALERLGRDVQAAGWSSVIDLEPLSERELMTCVEGRYGTGVAETLGPSLYGAGGGNPSVAIMTMDSLLRVGALQLHDAEWRVQPPPSGLDTVLATSLVGALQCQIDRLSSFDRAMLKCAADLTAPFTAEDLMPAMGVDEAVPLDRRLQSMAARHLLVDLAEAAEHSPERPAGFRLRHDVAADLLLDRPPLTGRHRAGAHTSQATDDTRSTEPRRASRTQH